MDFLHLTNGTHAKKQIMTIDFESNVMLEKWTVGVRSLNREQCKNRASRPSQGTVNGGAVSMTSLSMGNNQPSNMIKVSGCTLVITM